MVKNRRLKKQTKRSARYRMNQGRSKIVAGGMLRRNTPVEYYPEYGLWVKREDLSCPKPGPAFSKTRGVYAHVKKLKQEVVGVLDTYHSQAGHAVARACQILGKRCINYYPVYKREGELIEGGHELREPQIRSSELGAALYPLQAGRSCILYHQARKHCEQELGGYMMPNALKLEESVRETAKEVPDKAPINFVILPASSGTIAAGVIRGFCDRVHPDSLPEFIVHLGYSRSHDAVRKYLIERSGYSDWAEQSLHIIDEGYSYKDVAKPGPVPPWPCNEYYDLKAFRWWLREGQQIFAGGEPLFWNIG